MIKIDEIRKEEIQEEERLRAEARAQAEQDLKEKKKKEESKKAGVGCLVLLGIIVFSIMLILLTGGENAEKPVLTEAEQRVEMIENQFSAWDGSHYGLTRVIKEAMNDPSSYEHVITLYEDKGDHLIVQTTFRGKNAFGGVVLNTITAKVLLSGEVVEILSQD